MPVPTTAEKNSPQHNGLLKHQGHLVAYNEGPEPPWRCRAGSGFFPWLREKSFQHSQSTVTTLPVLDSGQFLPWPKLTFENGYIDRDNVINSWWEINLLQHIWMTIFVRILLIGGNNTYYYYNGMKWASSAEWLGSAFEIRGGVGTALLWFCFVFTFFVFVSVTQVQSILQCPMLKSIQNLTLWAKWAK